jgi:hypothetical protein
MATTATKRSIFRSQTIQTYIQNREKCVLPRIVAPPVFALCWIVLTLLIVAGITIWYGKIPLYITGSGIIPASPALDQNYTETTAIIVFPLRDVTYLQAGLPIQIQLGQTGPALDCRIAAVSPHPLSPDQIQQQYRLEVAGPSIVVTVNLGPAVPARLYAGSHVQAQFQIGAQSLLSLFPVLNSL